MSRNWRLFLQDIVEACEKILRYTSGLDFEAFTKSDVVYDAVLRNLEIIGESAKKIPIEIRQQFPNIEWRAIAGLRDVLAHAYFAVDDATLWDIVQNKVPKLLLQVRDILEGEG